MPALLPDVIAKVREKLVGGASLEYYEDNETLIKMVVQMTIETIGLAIDNHGEIYNPAPPPSATPRQQNVRWSGGGRRKR